MPKTGKRKTTFPSDGEVRMVGVKSTLDESPPRPSLTRDAVHFHEQDRTFPRAIT